jgi:hypothetical protein
MSDKDAKMAIAIHMVLPSGLSAHHPHAVILAVDRFGTGVWPIRRRPKDAGTKSRPCQLADTDASCPESACKP